MRKSVSWTYFSATAGILIVSTIALGLMQMALSVNYFSRERQTSLTDVVDITAAQLEIMTAGAEDVRSVLIQNSERRQVVELINTTTDAMLLFADEEGRILMNVGGTDVVGSHQLSQRLIDSMDTGADVFSVGDLDGVYLERRYTLGRKVQIGESPLYILASSSNIGMTQYLWDTTSIFFLSAGMMLLFASVLSILFTDRLTRPLRNITNAAQKFGKGDFSVRVPMEGDDELAQLAATFNGMAANLEAIDNSRSQFMGNIAHELRTPMTSIKGFVDGMLDGTIPPEMQHHYLELVSQEAGRLARLVQNMLDITKLEAGEYQVHATTYDVWESITGVVLGNEQRIEDGQVQILGLEPTRTQVYADPDLVYQVIYNLMDNALKFTPPEGSISFRVQRQGGSVKVSITNSGKGIAPEALPFVFERFYKEDKSRGLNIKGAGLGLHICKVLITMQGGSISVDSKEGEWTTFSFTLPENPPKK